MGAPARVALTTLESEAQAVSLARTLVEERLAACVNIVRPVRSVYRWEGEIEEADEVLLILKTTEDRLLELERRLLALHSYQVPEFLILEANGTAAYLDWIARSTAPA